MVRDGSFAVLGVVALVAAAYAWVHDPSERPVRLRMAAGRPEGERFRIAEALRREAGRRSIAIDLTETAGSEATLRALADGRLDAGLVQGGLDPVDHPEIRQAATLSVEPLHLLVKREIHPEVSDHLSGLKGRTVSLGEPGSGTSLLASDLIEFVGLKAGPAGSLDRFVAATIDYAGLLREADRDRLPDAVFLVSALPSAVARHLVLARDFRLVPLPFFEAFALGRTPESGPDATSGGRVRVERRNVDRARIPAFAYGIDPGVPPEPIETLGTRMLLVARAGVPAETVRRLVEVVYGSPFAQRSQPTLDVRLLDGSPELPWHDGTLAYLRRNAPAIAGDVVDLVEKEVSIAAALIGGLFFLAQWARRRYRRARDRGFQAYIAQVSEVERRAMALELAPSLDLAGLLALQRDLARLKAEALGKFADGELDGEELMSGFLSHVSDARDYLTRLILHRRESIEKRARREGRPARDLWTELVERAGPVVETRPGIDESIRADADGSR